MNWLNLRTSITRSPQYVGCEPLERATWFTLLAYCADQENGGVIRDCKSWKDRRWSQTCSVLASEVTGDCDLFWWDGDDLHVAFYPVEKEEQVTAGRKGGQRGGRPKKNPPENPPNNPCENPPQNPSDGKSKPSPIPPPKPEEKIREEKIREDNEREGEYPPPLCTIEQARSAASMNRMTEDEADHWWHTRNASGWTKGTTSGGAPRKITSWQSDMATSVQWVRESLAKHKQASPAKNHQAKLEWEQ